MKVPEAPLERGREEIRAAQVLLEADLPSQALSRAYLAAFHAASATLMAVGDVPTTRAGVLSSFGSRIVDVEGMAPDVGRALRRLYEDQNDVDYALTPAPAWEARRAIAEAERVIEAATEWIQERGEASGSGGG